LGWLVRFINGVKEALKNIYDYIETENRISRRLYDHVPVGTIVMWSPLESLPTGTAYEDWGWAICDGTSVVRMDHLNPNSSGLTRTYRTPDLRDRFIKAVGTTALAGVASPSDTSLENKVRIIGTQLPWHAHSFSLIQTGGTSKSASHDHDIGPFEAQATVTPPYTYLNGDGSNFVDSKGVISSWSYDSKVKWNLSRDYKVIFNLRQSLGGNTFKYGAGWANTKTNARNRASNDLNSAYGSLSAVRNISYTNYKSLTIDISHTHNPDFGNTPPSSSSLANPTTNAAVNFDLHIKAYSMIFIMKVPKRNRTSANQITGPTSTTSKALVW